MSTDRCGDQGSLLQEDTPDEEGANAPSRNEGKTITANSEKAESGVGVATVAQRRQTTRENGGSLGSDGNEKYKDFLAGANLDGQPDAKLLEGPRAIFAQLSSSIFPSPNDEDIQAYIPHYRILPILSGVTIPLCILLDIPGLLTTDWYIHTESFTLIALKANPPLLDVGIALSILCAILANASLVVRFLERRIKTMTILCICFLSIHDVINIVSLATFGATRDDYTYSQVFWMTFCSTLISMFTNATLITDLVRTPDFTRSGSGLTRRQRSLVIIIIGLFCYVVLGTFVSSLLLDLTFIDGLYFAVVTMTTIGFGDITPKSTSARVFICCYATLGVINLAFVIGYVRETVLEGLDFGYRRRLLGIQEKRRATRLRRRAEKRWRDAIIWRLREAHSPVWVPTNTTDRRSVWSMLTSCLRGAKRGTWSTAGRSTSQSHGQHGMQLNLWALSPYQLEAAALEAGAPLDTLLPANFYVYDRDFDQRELPSWFVIHPVYHRDEHPTEPPTYRLLGNMAAILTKLSIGIYESGSHLCPNGHGRQNSASVGDLPGASGSSGSLEMKTGDYSADVEDTEKKAYYTRSSLSWLWLLIFWMGGAALFKVTEGWTYGVAMYFCFISFTAIGYGDLAPATPAGRCIFVVWALIGVATVTMVISVVSEAYTVRYKGILGRASLKRAVRQYRERGHVEASGEVPTSAEGKRDLHGTLGRDGTLRRGGQGDVEHAKLSLEDLAHQVLMETRSIRQYLQLVGEFDARAGEAEGVVADEAVRTLIDDVVGGRRLSRGVREDILKDVESRRTLVLLGIERSVNALANISEQAIAIVQGQERIVAALRQE